MGHECLLAGMTFGLRSVPFNPAMILVFGRLIGSVCVALLTAFR
jgi:hypothetical protein